MVSNQQLIKETGATFTPVELANFISAKIFSYVKPENKRVKVLDPACGEGALLSSMSKKLIEEGVEFELLGYDSNKEFLKTAAKNFCSFSKDKISLNNCDFLEKIRPKKKQSLLFEQNVPNEFINNSIDIIIANPPYVRTQILGAEYAQKISKKFDLKGRVDLYYPFLIGMTCALKENGIIGVITSNRYLSTKSGISIRKFLDENFEILEIIDLGDSKLFDAAVLPAIFIGRKKSNNLNLESKFTKVYEELNGNGRNVKPVSNFYHILTSSRNGYYKANNKTYKKTSGVVKFIKSKDFSWNLLSNEEDKWVNKINISARGLIGDYFKVRVGIKTTADKIFIREGWEDQKNVPEAKLLKELISQQNIEPWSINEDKKLQVLYPHFAENGKKKTIKLEDYPNAMKYFHEHKEKLSSRKYLIEAGRNWFEIWVPHNPSLWKHPKLVFADISSYPRFYFDESKRLVNGNCYWITAKTPDDIDLLLLIQGVSNSLLMTKYHDLMFNNKLYSGRRRYFSQYVEKYPIPDINSAPSQKIISIVKLLNNTLTSEAEKEALIQDLEISVAKAYKVDPIFLL